MSFFDKEPVSECILWPILPCLKKKGKIAYEGKLVYHYFVSVVAFLHLEAKQGRRLPILWHF